MTDIDTPDSEPCYEEFGVWHVEAGEFLLGLHANDLTFRATGETNAKR